IESALLGIVPADHIFGTELDYDPVSGEVRKVVRVPAGYGKVSVLEELEAKHGTDAFRTIYVGDGSSDVHVMLQVNNRDGFWIATAVFAASYFAGPRALRRIQMTGALLWVVYGALVKAAPVVAANVLVLSAAAWTARRDAASRP